MTESLKAEINSLILFRKAARHVPAYRKFLADNKCSPKRIKSFETFKTVPLMNKKNYLHKHSLKDLCWPQSFSGQLVYTSTSGSTGLPTYFPRDQKLDHQYSAMLERFLLNSSYGANKPTLVIVGFGMGVWIGGLITYEAMHQAAERRKLPVSIITPGVNQDEILKALRELSPHYHQTILVGYPPFVKDIVDQAVRNRIDLKNHRMRFLFAAEAFTDNFRK